MPSLAHALPKIDIVVDSATIYDSSSVTPIICDGAISGDKIVYIGMKMLTPYPATAQTIDTRGLIVAPGLIDPHTHAGRCLDSGDATGR